MREREPKTHTMKSTQVRQEWSKLLTTVFRGEQRVLVEKSGIPVAALVSDADLDRLKQFGAQRAERWKVLDEIHAKNHDQDPEDVEREIAEEIATMRRERQDQAVAQDSG